MPIVASAVGGVPELIDETTGWPVSEGAEVDDYVNTIQDMLRSPDERVKRATQLQRRVAERHNQEAYLGKLSKLIA
jgi:glycosyltransferase involved in cell wall biosynthesis